MDNYNEIFMNQFEVFEGFWFINEDTKIGFSFATVYLDDDDNTINIETDCESELGNFVYDNWNDFFEHHSDLQIIFSLDLALEGKFYNWNEIKEGIDGKRKIVLGYL